MVGVMGCLIGSWGCPWSRTTRAIPGSTDWWVSWEQPYCQSCFGSISCTHSLHHVMSAFLYTLGLCRQVPKKDMTRHSLTLNVPLFRTVSRVFSSCKLASIKCCVMATEHRRRQLPSLSKLYIISSPTAVTNGTCSRSILTTIKGKLDYIYKPKTPLNIIPRCPYEQDFWEEASNVGLPLVNVSKVVKSSWAKEQRMKHSDAFHRGNLLVPLNQSMKKPKATAPTTEQRAAEGMLLLCCRGSDIFKMGSAAVVCTRKVLLWMSPFA
jgi:hypothetical protein